jgi:DNA-binding transcriptional ArsR family regulator
MDVPLYQAKAELFRALAHPVRIRVLELLDEGPQTVRQLLEAVAVEVTDLLATARRILTHLSLGQRQLLAELRTERAS